jgi:hypothetical protein
MQDCNRDWFWQALWLYKRQSRGNEKKKNETGENRRKNGEAEHEPKQKKTQGR